MNKQFRTGAAPLLLVAAAISVVLAGCGTSGKVTVSSPGAGAGLRAASGAATTTTSAAPPAGIPLYQAPSTGFGVEPLHGPLKMNTKAYSDTSYAELACSGSQTWEFDLNRGYQKLTATLGVDDNSVAKDEVTVTFTGDDNAKLGQTKVQLGQVTPIEVPLGNVLRLRIDIAHSVTACNSATGYGTTVGFGSGRLVK
jgi:hypothetical protein